MCWHVGCMCVYPRCAAAAAAAAGCRYTGSQGIYTHTVAYERNAQCPVCSPGVELNAPAGSTLQEVRSASGQWCSQFNQSQSRLLSDASCQL